MTTPTPRPRDDDELVDNLPDADVADDGSVPRRGTEDVEGVPDGDPDDTSRDDERRSDDEGIENRPGSRDSDREDLESP
jgi:hypothetical protein